MGNPMKEIRAKLDELGIKYGLDMSSTNRNLWWHRSLWWRTGGVSYSTTEVAGKLKLIVYYLTPEQVIAVMMACNDVSALRAKVEAENAKLRELVRDMWRLTGTACKKYPRLFDPSAQGGQMVQLNMINAFEQRMDDLGIEVEE